MEVIEFKGKNESAFLKYINIGYTGRDYYSVNFYLPDCLETRSSKLYFESYNSWFENFKEESVGSKLMVLNYYVNQYLGWSFGENEAKYDDFLNVYGIKTANIIKENLQFFDKFLEKWFINQTTIFKGLDLTDDDMQDYINSHSKDENDNKLEIEFKDGSSVRFLNDVNTKSFFVLKSKYSELVSEIDIITEKFNILD